MLSKIMKYENKAIGRLLGPLYLALAGVSLVTGIILRITGSRFADEENIEYYAEKIVEHSRVLEVLSTILMITFVLLIMAILFATIFMIIVRFNRGCLGDEGYLTFTLPVGIDTQLWARILTAALWTVFSILMMMICTAILLIGANGLHIFDDLIPQLQELFAQEGVLSFVLHGLLYFVVSLLACPILLYFCMTTGQQIMPKHRIVGAFVVYFGLTMIAQIAMTIFGFVGLGNSYILDYLFNVEPMIFFHNVMWFALGLEIVEGVAAYLLTRYFLTKKLNLE